MTIINQPKDGRLGDSLIKNLIKEDDYTDWVFYLIAAYANKSGVTRLRQAITEFRKKGGIVTATIGVDQENTTLEGLVLLLTLTNELYIYHNESTFQTFHPKIYVFEKKNTYARCFVGSSNLTCGGLFTNYEAIEESTYDLQKKVDVEAYSKIRETISSYQNVKSKCCLKLDESLLQELIHQGYLIGEEEKNKTRLSEGGKGRFAKGNDIKALFGYEKFAPPPVIIITEGQDGVKANEIPEVNPIKSGFWKRLRPSDVSLTSSPGQIIIPIKFSNLFPSWSEAEQTEVGGGQSESNFKLIYRSSKGIRSKIENVRAVKYIPAPKHPRKNVDLRFTFLSREITSSLKEGDILLFRHTDNQSIWFEVTHIKRGTKNFEGISFEDKRWGFVID